MTEPTYADRCEAERLHKKSLSTDIAYALATTRATAEEVGRLRGLEEAAVISDTEEEPDANDRPPGMTEREATLALAGIRATKKSISKRIRALKEKP